MRQRIVWTACGLLMLGIMSVWAQQGEPPAGPQGAPGQGEHRPKPPIERALDTNGDGVIDAGEIGNASSSLKTLDKNKDGKLTPDEYRPPRPPHPDDQGAGH